MMLKVINIAAVLAVGESISATEERYCDMDVFEKDEFGTSILDEEAWKKVQATLELMAEMAATFSRTTLSALLTKYATQASPMSQEAFYIALDFFRKEVFEIQTLSFTAGKEAHYRQDQYFGDEVEIAFPSASLEIEDCGSCFALSQHTAAVFHSLRALEIPLLQIARNFGVAKFNNWNEALNEVEALVRNRENRDNIPNWAAQKDFYTDAINHLFAVKNAWRNYTMHLHRRFDENDASEVIAAVKAFMRKAAKVVSETPNVEPRAE